MTTAVVGVSNISAYMTSWQPLVDTYMWHPWIYAKVTPFYWQSNLTSIYKWQLFIVFMTHGDTIHYQTHDVRSVYDSTDNCFWHKWWHLPLILATYSIICGTFFNSLTFSWTLTMFKLIMNDTSPSLLCLVTIYHLMRDFIIL